MSQQELLTDIVATLRTLRVEFMLSGSHASSVHGEPRATHHIDLVVRLTQHDADRFFAAFDNARFYLSRPAMIEAIQSKRTFNLLESRTGEKVDFWVLTDSAFDQSRFARRQSIDFGEQSVEVSSPEDTILMKLSWCQKSGGSEKQLHDARSVYELQSDVLDRVYLEKWAFELGVTALWQRLVAEADPFIP